MILGDKKNFDPAKSKWYNGQSAKTGDIITILTEAKWIEVEFDGKVSKKLNCKISVNGSEKDFTMNGYAKTALEEAFGEDTKNWIGQKARTMLMPTPKGDKKMIVLEAIIEQ